VVRGDLGDVASLRAAMHGVDKVFMISTGTNAVALEGNVVDAAVAEGVKHIVKLSVISAEAPAGIRGTRRRRVRGDPHARARQDSHVRRRAIRRGEAGDAGEWNAGGLRGRAA